MVGSAEIRSSRHHADCLPHGDGAAVNEQQQSMNSSTGRTAVLAALSRFFDELDEAIVVVDAEGRIENVNGAFSRGSGYSADRIFRTPLVTLVAVDQAMLLSTFVAWQFGQISVPSPAWLSTSFRITLGVACDSAWALSWPDQPSVSAVEVVMRWAPLPEPDLAAVVVQPVHPVEPDRNLVQELARAGAATSEGGSSGRLFERRTQTGRARPPLSLREREILHLVLNGNRVSTIAAGLFLSENTVRNHLKRIYRKIGVNSLGELRESIQSNQQASLTVSPTSQERSFPDARAAQRWTQPRVFG